MIKTDDIQLKAYFGLFQVIPEGLFPVSVARGFGPASSPAQPRPLRSYSPDRKGFPLQFSSQPQGGDSGFNSEEDVSNGGSGKGGT